MGLLMNLTVLGFCVCLTLSVISEHRSQGPPQMEINGFTWCVQGQTDLSSQLWACWITSEIQKGSGGEAVGPLGDDYHTLLG